MIKELSRKDHLGAYKCGVFCIENVASELLRQTISGAPASPGAVPDSNAKSLRIFRWTGFPFRGILSGTIWSDSSKKFESRGRHANAKRGKAETCYIKSGA